MVRGPVPNRFKQSSPFKRDFILGFFGVIAGLYITSCGEPGSPSSSLSDLAFDRTGNNVALLFSAPGGLEGPPTDIKKMKELLEDSDQPYGFKVFTLDNATLPDILKMTKEHAANADSLIWYFSGHGANDGSIAAEDGLFKFGEISSSIKEVRSSKPLKRLIALIDICFAGNLVDGATPVITEPDAETGPGGTPNGNAEKSNFDLMTEDEYTELVADQVLESFDTKLDAPGSYDKALYEQALVVASSTKTQSSADLGAEEGGAFTKALREAWAKLKQTKRETATIRELVDQAAVGTAANGHNPVYRAYPGKAVLDDLLFQVTFVDPARQLFALLSDPRSTGAASVYVSAGQSLVSDVRLCKADKKTCSEKLTEDIAFKKLESPAIQGRVIFKSEAPMLFTDGDSFTLLGLDANNALVEAQAISFTSKNTTGGN